jgi:nucleoside-triphosphatase
MRLFLTGNPGIGKTTVIRATLKGLQGIRCAGFYTEEIREKGERVGFRVTTLDGHEGTLASVGVKKGPRVGKYTVHVKEFEELVLPFMDPEGTPADLYVIDEIGKMELLSQRFRDTLLDLLDRPTNLLATIAKRGKGLIEQIKEKNDIELIEATKDNRDQLPQAIAQRIIKEIMAG